MSYTKEQLKYINYDKKNHTKLLACAGSGKTRCIIARINRLLENNIYKADEILMLTFSRFTRDDFINKIKTYGGTCISVNSVKTIDSFAKQIIDPNGTVDVSLLSFRLMKFLETENKITLNKINILQRIKIVFIDEAQDLNEIQYNIFRHMREKLEIVINMVGDPNQNIYQFRDASDKYLTEFDATVFKLTRNFRSHVSIVDFSKYLRPFGEHDIVCTKGHNNCKPIMMFYEDEKILETNIIDLLKSAQEQNIDLSEFAILSPTRGRMRAGGRSHGLCFISNVLYGAKIKFKQFYEESVDEVSCEGIKYSPSKGHVNIMTYMGSKGLEWNYVIIIDADACLINKRYFNETKHNHDRYLLYVACSRAIHNMYIFSRCYFRNGSLHFNTNPWFESIPPNFYCVDNRFTDHFFFPELRYVNFTEQDCRLGRIIDKLNYYDLDELSTLIGFQTRKIKFQKKIFKQDYSSLEKLSAIFLSKYTESIFQALYNIRMKRNHVPYPQIENVVNTDNIVTGMQDEVIKWYYQNRKSMTWNKFDNNDSIPGLIKEAIDRGFDRNKEFNTHAIAIDGYYQWFILNQKTWIKNLYCKYLKCKNSSQIRDILFYLIVVIHGMDTQHYFHIKSKGKKYYHILDDFREMFDEMEDYVDVMDHNFITVNESVGRWEMVSRIDYVDENDQIWTVKCANEISLKQTLHSIVTTLMYRDDVIGDDLIFMPDNHDNTITININYINFMKGDEISYEFVLTSETIKRIIEIMHASYPGDKNVQDVVLPDKGVLDTGHTKPWTPGNPGNQTIAGQTDMQAK
jgi:hypothetical protein